MQSPKNRPLLQEIRVTFPDTVDFARYPFSLPIIKNLRTIQFPTQVTFLVGENGTGKSTILEAIARHAGFGPEGGSKNIYFRTSVEHTYTTAEQLADCMTLSWRVKPQNGYFFRAESFFNVATYLDTLPGHIPYGGKPLHEQSHGESFLAFFNNRLGNGGFFIFDEPEAALSPQRQLSLLSVIHQMCKKGDFQAVIATHSPLLLAYPGATIYSCDADRLTPIEYKETEHYKVTKQFIDNPERFLSYLFEE